ncbi:MAG: hypothetical protein ACON5K_11570 [Bacteroidia bacterium]
MNEITIIRKELELYYVYTGEYNEFKLDNSSILGRKLLQIDSNQQQDYLNNKDSNLRITHDENGSILLKLKNVT